MKYLLALAGFLITHTAFGGIVISPAVVSQEDMLTRGVAITLTVSADGIVPNYTVDITIDFKNGDSYKKCELVVLKNSIVTESLTSEDINLDDRISRIKRSTGKIISYSVFGKEYERAYIAIEALVGFDKMAIYRRYLIPIATIKEKKPNCRVSTH